jgi:Tol biopolymer transport system component
MPLVFAASDPVRRKQHPMRLISWLILVLVSTACTAMGATVYQDLGRAGTHPSLSSDGGRLVFEDQGAIWLYQRSTGATTRIDRTATAVANAESSQPVISSDGSVVAFISLGSNLVPGDTNNQQDVFARVLATGAIQRVSVRTDGSQTSSQFGAYFHLSISGDGRYVAFDTANALVPSDSNTLKDVYVRDRTNGTTTRESVTSSGGNPDGDCTWPSLSGSGTLIAYASTATNIVTGSPGVIVRDRSAGVVRAGSADPSGSPRSGFAPALSQDGRYVAFVSSEAFMPDAGSSDKVYERELATGRVYLAGKDEGYHGGFRDHFGVQECSISADGRFVTYGTDRMIDAGSPPFHVYDRIADIISTLPIAGSPMQPAISANGMVLAIANFSTPNHLLLVDRSGDRAPVVATHDLAIVSDRDSPAIGRVRPGDVSAGTSDPDGDPLIIRMSPLGPFPIGTTTVTITAYDGMFSVQRTARITVSANQAPSAAPVTISTERVGINSLGGQGNFDSMQPWTSRDGRFVAFASSANSLDPSEGDFQNPDVFVRDRSAQVIASVDSDSDTNVYNTSPRISDDGRYVLYAYSAGGISARVYDRTTRAFAAMPLGMTNANGISRNGRYVAYGDNTSLFIFDQSTGARVAYAPNDETDRGVAISDDGRYVAYTDQRADGTGSQLRILDRSTGVVTTPTLPILSIDHQSLSMTSDGRYLALATGTLPQDVILYDRVANTSRRPVRGTGDTAPNGSSRQPSLSADGRFLAFASDASNLVPADTNGVADVFRMDLVTGRLLRVSVGKGDANGASFDPRLSGDGFTVVYASSADDLVDGDTNGVADIFATRITEQGSQPYGGAPRPVPGRLYSRDYDTGGEGLAYHDNDATNTGGQYRPNEGVDLSTSSAAGSIYLAATNAGEWLNYTIEVANAGPYTIMGRYSSPFTSGRFHLENANGTVIGGPWAVPSTGGWQVWQTRAFGTAQLAAGRQTLRLVIDGGNFNLDYLEYAATSPPPGSFATKINFQPASAAPVAGYMIDGGAPYGARNGLSYGWNSACESRERNVVGDQRIDTLVLMQASANPNARWEIAVPSGTYTVHVACGDPSYFDGSFALQVEGTLTVTGRASSATPIHEGTVTVQVVDGRLTLTNGSGSYNTKICYIEIQQMPTSNG